MQHTIPSLPSSPSPYLVGNNSTVLLETRHTQDEVDKDGKASRGPSEEGTEVRDSMIAGIDSKLIVAFKFLLSWPTVDDGPFKL